MLVPEDARINDKTFTVAFTSRQQLKALVNITTSLVPIASLAKFGTSPSALPLPSTMPDSQEQKEHNPEVNDHDEAEEDETTPSSEPSTSSKSKTKKMKSKLKSLLSRKGNEEIRVDEIQETFASASLEDKKALSVDDQEKLRLLMKRVNEMVPPGAKKDIADHKFWKTQPVIKFGRLS